MKKDVRLVLEYISSGPVRLTRFKFDRTDPWKMELVTASQLAT